MSARHPSNERATVPLIRLRHLLWLIAIGALALAVQLYGTPHLRLVYQYTGPASMPYYRYCEYGGLRFFSVRPLDGRCPLIVFANAEARRG